MSEISSLQFQYHFLGSGSNHSLPDTAMDDLFTSLTTNKLDPTTEVNCLKLKCDQATPLPKIIELVSMAFKKKFWFTQ